MLICNEEDFFRPVELIVYYVGKIISSDSTLKDKIRDWMDDFCSEYEGDMVAEQYFRPFHKAVKRSIMRTTITLAMMISVR